MATLTADTADFQTRTTAEDKGRYLIIIKLVTCQEVINTINMYVCSNKVLKYINKKMDRTKKIVDKFINFWRV